MSHVPVGIRILDVNDNPPELAREYDVVVCENAKPGQVTLSYLFLSVKEELFHLLMLQVLKLCFDHTPYDLSDFIFIIHISSNF